MSFFGAGILTDAAGWQSKGAPSKKMQYASALFIVAFILLVLSTQYDMGVYKPWIVGANVVLAALLVYYDYENKQV